MEVVEDKKHESFRLHLSDLRNSRLKRPETTFDNRRKRYHRFPWRTYRDFGFPHYTDEQGREYRNASDIVLARFQENTLGRILEIKLPIRRGPFTGKHRLEFPEEGSQITLEHRRYVIDEVFHAPRGRTGVVIVHFVKNSKH